MVKSLKSGMGELTIHVATSPGLWIIVLALFGIVKILIWRSSMVKRFVEVNAMVPIMVFGLVWAQGSFVSINIEHDWLNVLEIDLQSFLEGFICRNAVQFVSHIYQVIVMTILSLSR